MIIAIIDVTIEETVLTAVIGELVFRRLRNSFFGLARDPPFLKYMIETMIDEITQAKLKDSAVLFVRDILKKVDLNKIIKMIILVTCSINSVKLIVKKLCIPQRAPRKTSYIELEIKAGKRIIIISVDAFDVNSRLRRLGKNNTIIETTKQMTPVKINPDDTIEPIAFLLCFPA